jgi:hypothetical protein
LGGRVEVAGSWRMQRPASAVLAALPAFVVARERGGEPSGRQGRCFGLFLKAGPLSSSNEIPDDTGCHSPEWALPSQAREQKGVNEVRAHS